MPRTRSCRRSAGGRPRTTVPLAAHSVRLRAGCRRGQRRREGTLRPVHAWRRSGQHVQTATSATCASLRLSKGRGSRSQCGCSVSWYTAQFWFCLVLLFSSVDVVSRLVFFFSSAVAMVSCTLALGCQFSGNYWPPHHTSYLLSAGLGCSCTYISRSQPARLDDLSLLLLQ
jgi:hypothetical protein